MCNIDKDDYCVLYSMYEELNLGSYAIIIFYVIDGPCMLA